MAKKSQGSTATAAAGNGSDDETNDNTAGKENSNVVIMTPEVLEAMAGRGLVGLDGRKRRIHVETEESGYTSKKPDPEDVLLGRGRPIQNHPGNQHMLRLVQNYRVEYDAISRNDKYRVVEEIMATIKAKGGRFMEHVEHSETEGEPADYWKEVSKSNAYNKITHAFRSLRRQNLPADQRPARSSKKSKEADPNAVAANPIMASMMHNGMMGYGAPGFPPMMNPADMGMAGFMPSPWGPVMHQAMWQQHLMGAAAPAATPDPSKDAAPAESEEGAAAASTGEGEDSSKNVYEV